jgi:integrase
MNTSIANQEPMIMPETALALFGVQANHAAARAAFALYQDRRPANTQRSQRAALAVFARFMREAGIAVPDLYANPAAWSGITWGLVQGFQRWLLEQDYAVKSVNDRISIVRTYMVLANQAGVIPDDEILRLRGLRGFTRKESVDIDAKRVDAGMRTRRGAKKVAAVQVSEEQAQTLCQVRGMTAQARRDACMMTLLFDHGLRVSELAALTMENIDREARMLRWYRQKTGADSKHVIRGRAWQRLEEYLIRDHPAPAGALLLASCKTGALVEGSNMSIEGIRKRVRQLGRLVGLINLSPHDCRHYGATRAGNDANVSLAGLMHWGGWESPTSAARYIDRGQADNDGVNLGME